MLGYTKTEVKLEMIEVLDYCIAPSICFLKDQSIKERGLTGFDCNKYLCKTKNLTGVLREVLKQYDSKSVRNAVLELYTLLDNVNITIVNYYFDDSFTNGSTLCSNLEAVKIKVLELLVMLND